MGKHTNQWCVFKMAYAGAYKSSCMPFPSRSVIAPRNTPSCFFISHFTVSVAPSINRPDFSNETTILIISSVFSFEMNKGSHFPALTGPCPLISLSNLSNTNKVVLVEAKHL